MEDTVCVGNACERELEMNWFDTWKKRCLVYKSIASSPGVQRKLLYGFRYFLPFGRQKGSEE